VDATNLHAIFRPNQPGLKKVLGDLEAEIMEGMWAADRPMQGRDLHPQLPTGHALSYSTIVCTLTTLEKKNLLHMVAKDGKSRIYIPTMSREDFLHQTLGHVLDNILEAFPDTASAILSQRREPHTLAQLRQLTERVAQLDT